MTEQRSLTCKLQTGCRQEDLEGAQQEGERLRISASWWPGSRPSGGEPECCDNVTSGLLLAAMIMPREARGNTTRWPTKDEEMVRSAGSSIMGKCDLCFALVFARYVKESKKRVPLRRSSVPRPSGEELGAMAASAASGDVNWEDFEVRD